MKNNFEDKKFLLDFNSLLNELEIFLKKEEYELLGAPDLKKIANYISGLKPLSKMRKHKQNLLNYLRQVKEIKVREGNAYVELSFKARLSLAKRNSLEPVLSYLNAFHGFIYPKVRHSF